MNYDRYGAVTPVPRARLHEIFVGAYNHLVQHGWIKHWRSPTNSTSQATCAMGALAIAAGSSPGPHIRNNDEVHLAACALGFSCIGLGVRWNDHATEEEVLACLAQGIQATAPPLEVEDQVVEVEVEDQVETETKELVLA